MARTSAKAKKSKQEVLKSKAEEAQKEQAAKESEDTNESTDKENDDNNYEVEKIVHSRTYRGKKQYLVRWKGYSDDNDTWENESVLSTCAEALEAFKKENEEKEQAKNNSEDENEVEENAKAKKKGRPKSSKKTDNEEESQAEDAEENGATETSEAKKRPAKNKVTLPPKKAKREEKKSEDEDGEDDKDDEKDYEVEKILEVHTRKDGKREFLIRWKGYRPSEDTWEPEAHLDCPDLIDKFMERVEKAKSIPARELRESRNPVDRFVPDGKVHGRSNLRRNLGFRGLYQE